MSNLISFGGSDVKRLDDSMSLTASGAEELSGSVIDLTPLLQSKASDAKPGVDGELFHVLCPHLHRCR